MVVHVQHDTFREELRSQDQALICGYNHIPFTTSKGIHKCSYFLAVNRK